mmetsp:Transcript_26025/g.35935  ORF Transcript_26025/g.35935 Transcript_26025/m.35935 type:complete len:178 (-) Transcript_26025:108-641(-)
MMKRKSVKPLPSPPVFQCRICFCSEINVCNLFSPCACRGTSAYVHFHCLVRWAESSSEANNWRRCPTCHIDYSTELAAELATRQVSAESTRRGTDSGRGREGRRADGYALEFLYLHRQSELGAMHPHTMRARDRLAKLWMAQGKRKEVTNLFKETTCFRGTTSCLIRNITSRGTILK